MAFTTEGRQAIELEVGANEGSDLLEVEDRDLLELRGWDWAVWVVLDDVPVEDGIVICGHEAGADPDEGWTVEHAACKPLGGKGRTDDSEASARHDGYVYVFGSHFGSKEGPLERERQFVARFEERQASRGARGGKLLVEIARNKFRLHRLVNDALAEFGPDLTEIDEDVQADLVRSARRDGKDDGKRWAKRIHKTDVPLNIEGAEFRADGSLLLGLRYPTTAGGQPLIAELRGVQTMFGDFGGDPEVVAFHVLDGIGTPEVPEGIRGMRFMDGELHALTGNLDSDEDASVLLSNDPEAARGTCTHVAAEVPVPTTAGQSHVAPARRLREFEDLYRIEGIARDPEGRFWYVSDDDDAVVLRYFEER